MSTVLKILKRTLNKIINNHVWKPEVLRWTWFLSVCGSVVACCWDVWEDQTEELFHLCSGCSPAALICWPQANVTVFLIHVVAQDLDLVTSLVKGNLQCQQDSKPGEVSNDRMPSSAVKKEGLDLDLDLELENDHHDGDSFFDDPLPKPQKTYGWWGCVTSHWPSLSVVSCLIVIGPVWLHPYSVSL